jgi:N-acetylneuraminic acid mutarotase
MRKMTYLMLILFFLMLFSLVIVNPVFSSDTAGENSWVWKAPMQVARSGPGIAVVNGKIYAIGGSTLHGFPPYTGGAVGITEEYDPTTDSWTYKTSKPTPGGFAIATYQNKIYCIGEAGTEIYDPMTDTWKTGTPMPTPRHGLEASVVDDMIYLIGGYDSSLPYGGDATNVNEVYDPKTDTWSTRAPMPSAVRDYASAVVGDKIYIIGGDRLGYLQRNLNQIYDTTSDTWSYGAPFPLELRGGAAGVTKGVDAPEQIYVFGAMYDIEEVEYSVRVYDPESDSWRIGANIPTSRRSFGVAVVNDLLYVVGGVTSQGEPFDIAPVLTKYATNERYTPFGYGTITPKVGLVSPENKTYNVTGVSLVFTVNKAVSWVGYSFDGQENVTVVGNTTLAGLTDGLHSITVFARDEFGNTGASETLLFTVDLPLAKTLPILPAIAASGATVAIVVVSLVYYYKKRRQQAS